MSAFDKYRLSREIAELKAGDTVVYERGVFNRTTAEAKVERRTPKRAYLAGGGWVRLRDGKMMPSHRFGYAEVKEVRCVD